MENSFHNLPYDLGEGLILRRSTPEDAEALSAFNAALHSDGGPQEPDEAVAAWTRDLLVRPHPTFKPQDFTLVEDTQNHKIVSSLNLISQTWSYGGVSFGVGRPELVGTLPEYRNRGLVRAQFDVVHRWSAERGELLQAITGIPFYYRQFGYEMALDLNGGRRGVCTQIPPLKPDEQEPYRIRPALEEDLNWMAEVYQQSSLRYLVHCERDQALWRYELLGRSQQNAYRFVLMVIETLEGQALGYFAHASRNWEDRLGLWVYELKPGISYSAVSPSVLRYLCQTGKKNAQDQGKPESFAQVTCVLGAEHPLFEAYPDVLPMKRNAYAWYLRVPDLPGFLRHVSPVLEKRLARSAFSGHTGSLRVSFYRTGLELGFENGKLVQVSDWKPVPKAESGDAAFPGLTFLQLVFGYRSLEELNHAFADCWWEDDRAFGLLTALFPRQVSNVWAVA